MLNWSFFENRKIIKITGLRMRQINNSERREKALEMINKNIQESGMTWLKLSAKSYILVETTRGLLTEALDSCEKAYQLKPKDPRSSYNLATIYRHLAKSKYEDYHPRMIQTNNFYRESRNFFFMTGLLRATLKEKGINLEAVLNRFLECSYKALELSHREPEKKHIQTNILMMTDQYPECLPLDKNSFKYLNQITYEHILY